MKFNNFGTYEIHKTTSGAMVELSSWKHNTVEGST